MPGNMNIFNAVTIVCQVSGRRCQWSNEAAFKNARKTMVTRRRQLSPSQVYDIVEHEGYLRESYGA